MRRTTWKNCWLPKLVEDCEHLLSNNFIFQQDGSPAQTARVTQDWLESNCSDFIANDEWPPNSLDLNPMDYRVGGGGNAGVLAEAAAEATDNS